MRSIFSRNSAQYGRINLSSLMKRLWILVCRSSIATTLGIISIHPLISSKAFCIPKAKRRRRLGDALPSRNSAFDTMFKPFDEILVSSLQRWADISTKADIRTISRILGEAPPTFVFEQRAFVVRFLERAKQFGKGVVDEAISAVFRSAISGVRSGNLGEPTPEDLATKQVAEKALGELPRFSPAFALYESIARHAVWSIDMSIHHGEAFEE